MHIAVIGTGISGLLAARLLHAAHTVSVFEANDYIGGHTHTVPVRAAGGDWAIDTGFIVYNERAYPHFTRMLRALNVATQRSDMSFSVRHEGNGLEYMSASLNAIFAQRHNLWSAGFWRMLRDMFRFFREAHAILDSGHTAAAELTLGQFLEQGGYSREFREWHILPLGAAIWSTDTEQIAHCPLPFFLRFFDNHGFLQALRRPAWRTIRGGSANYIGPLVGPLRERVHLNSRVEGLRRFEDRVELRLAGGRTQRFDHVVIAAHSDQALQMLEDPSGDERGILSAIRYQTNEVVLHTDASLLPRLRRAWASWNYHVVKPRGESAGWTTVTYWMNRLQRLENAPENFCVSLNRTDTIDARTIKGRFTYAHPLYTRESVAAQARWRDISGVNRTHYCGAYWGYGFHEDGVRSALAVAHDFGLDLSALETPARP